MSERVRIVPFGEAALLVELGDDIDEATNRRVVALRTAIETARRSIEGIGATVAGYTTVLVSFDAAVISVDTLKACIKSMVAALVTPPVAGPGPIDPEPAPVEVPVRYGGEGGPDLIDVAARLGLHPDDVVEMHMARVYRVFLLGFAPGFAYLGPLSETLRLPRRDEPRLRVPAGSVAMASAQTAVYPFATAGGWHLLGATEMSFWDSTSASPALLAAGDRVRFVAV
jgi:KipI family sensor histidine kinase inhibitor